MLNIQIKAYQISNLTDARYFAAMGVQWLGFSLETGNEEYLNPLEIKGIIEWVEGPEIIGSFGLQSPEEILTLARDIGIDFIQLNQFFPAEQLHLLNSFPIIQEIVIENDLHLKEIWSIINSRIEEIDYFILDFEKNKLSWEDLLNGELALSISEIQQLQLEKPILVALNIAGHQIPEFIKQLPNVGLSLKGGAEEKLGYKSFDELDEIFEALEGLEA